MKEPLIKIGIITQGVPEFKDGMLQNLLIGEKFHWQREQEVKLEGEFQPLTPPQGNIHIINVLPLERYLHSVVGSEMNPHAHTEFLKAHAVISRSWAMRKIINLDSTLSEGKIESSEEICNWDESDSHIGFHVCSDDHCQRYQGVPHEGAERAAAAVDITRGEIIADASGVPADARFSKCCGGITEKFSTCWADSDHPYLKVTKDRWCNLTDLSEEARSNLLVSSLKDYDADTDFYNWNTLISKKEIKKNLFQKFGRDIGEIERISIDQRSESGRAMRLHIQGSTGSLKLGKELMIRRLLSESHLKSSLFEIEDKGKEIKLRGRGWGHGVGLCQIGAARMAAEGKNYREILQFYYPTTQIINIYD